MIFRRGPEPEPAPTSPARSAAQITAELGKERDSLTTLTAKLEAAQTELEDAQRVFDDAMRAHALTGGAEPDRRAIQAAIAKVDALRRISADLPRRVAALETELAELLLAEARAAGRARLRLLTAAATAATDEFLSSMQHTMELERKAFDLCFGESSGLKEGFATPELTKSAFTARWDLVRKIQNAAATLDFSLRPEWRNDGVYNAGERDDAFAFQHQLARAFSTGKK